MEARKGASRRAALEVLERKAERRAGCVPCETWGGCSVAISSRDEVRDVIADLEPESKRGVPASFMIFVPRQRTNVI